jgi:deoxyhypusine synthase
MREKAKRSMYHDAPDIVPVRMKPGVSAANLVDLMGKTCFEARNLAAAADLLRRMIEEDDTIWLGISGAGMAGGLGGMVSQLVERGVVQVVCSTGAQIYHDLHFAFGLPVKAVSPHADDDRLRRHGDTRIYDIGIRETETLEAQDAIICRFIEEQYESLRDRPLSSADFNYRLGQWVGHTAPHPEHSFTVAAAEHGVPIFWDSHTNHSIAMNIAHMAQRGKSLHFPVDADISQSAAIVYATERTGFLELGGGGPKNFIQQTGPYLSQILGRDYEGAGRGIQISTADPRDGGLSGCTFSEAVTWKKYRHTSRRDLVQVWAEYSMVLPFLTAYVLERCVPREPARLLDDLNDMTALLEGGQS